MGTDRGHTESKTKVTVDGGVRSGVSWSGVNVLKRCSLVFGVRKERLTRSTVWTEEVPDTRGECSRRVARETDSIG